MATRLLPRWLAGLHAVCVLALFLSGCDSGSEEGITHPNGSGTLPSIQLTLSPSNGAVGAGDVISLTTTVTRGGGFEGQVQIFLESAPSGVTGQISGMQTQGTTTTASLAIQTSSNTPAGSHNLTVRAAASGVEAATAPFALTVSEGDAGGDGDGNGQSGQVTVERLHTLQVSEGQYTVGRLIEASDGSLLGVTQLGGTNDCGTVFRITPQGQFSVLHHFHPETTGCESTGGLIRGPETEEVFYGVTQYQGRTPDGGLAVGTIYRITPAGDVEVIHSLPLADIRAPVGRLLLASDGNFYGMTRGAGVQGRLFRLTQEGVFSTLHDFNESEGSIPFGGLTEGTDGLLYGIAGATVFRISTGGAFEPLHTFAPLQGVHNGEGRPGPFDGPMILGPDGNLWGTTGLGGNSGAGSTFRVTPGGEFTAFVAPSFAQGTVIAAGVGGVEPGTDGQLYGVRIEVTRFNPADGSYTLLRSGGPGQVSIPNEGGPLTRASDGRYYGITRAQLVEGELRAVIFRLTGLEQ